MPKTLRDVLKRHCDQAQLHIFWVRKHMADIFAPYETRPETQNHTRLKDILTETSGLEKSIIELRKNL